MLIQIPENSGLFRTYFNKLNGIPFKKYKIIWRSIQRYKMMSI